MKQETLTYKQLIEDGMMPHAAFAFTELQKAGCPVKEWHTDERGHFWIDAEESGAAEWLDYWSHSLMTGSDRLNSILEKHGLYFEWCNPGYAHVYNS